MALEAALYTAVPLLERGPIPPPSAIINNIRVSSTEKWCILLCEDAMRLNDVLAQIAPTGAQISGREPDPDGDGYIMWIGRPSEMVIPFAVSHCIPIHVDNYDNPDLHEEEAKAVLRRFSLTKKSPGKMT